MPLISVLIPAYNAVKTLPACIDSILAQTEPDFEVIIVEDGSTDDTPALCDQIARQDARIRVIHRTNEGVGMARNTALDAAKGEYLCFVDSDDYVSPHYLALLLDMCRTTGKKMALAGYEVIHDGDPVPAWQADPGPVEVIDTMDYYRRLYTIHEALYVVPWGKLYHRSVYESVRYPKLQRCDDESVIHRLAENAGGAAVSPTPIYGYYMSQNSVMRQNGFRPALLDGDVAYQMRGEFFAARSLGELLYLNQRVQAASLLAIYGWITDDTPDAAKWRAEVKRRYDAALKGMCKNKAASKRCILKLLALRLQMKPGAQFDRTALLFGSDPL